MSYKHCIIQTTVAVYVNGLYMYLLSWERSSGVEGTGERKLNGCVLTSGVPVTTAGVWGEGHMVTADDARLSNMSPLSSNVV